MAALNRTGLAAALAALLALPGPARAQGAPDPFSINEGQAKQYAGCMAEARRRPEQAHRMALAWRTHGGGHPAMHCVAVALLGMGDYVQAASQLAALSDDMKSAPDPIRAELLGQAGNAWLIGGKPAAAEAALDRALKLAPGSVSLSIDRGIARASRGKVWDALDDYNRALERDPDRIDALVFRATAWRRAGSLDLAAEDANRALVLAPDNLDALLERGEIRKTMGQPAGARADWLRVIELAAEGPVREAARRSLEEMDVKTR